MRCPLCTTDDTRVIDSRPSEGGYVVRRRRRCSTCGYRFTTYETSTVVITVRKRSGAIEPFDARKVRRGLESALADRPVAADSVDAIIAEIEAAGKASGLELTSDDIGRLVLEGLRRVDEVAYLRFASVYKDFQGASDFEAEMAALEADD